MFKYDYYMFSGKTSGLLGNFFKHHELRFLFFLRLSEKYGGMLSVVYKLIYMHIGKKYGLEIYAGNIGKGLYLGHAYGITVNPKAVLGDYVSLHKGSTIGQENRGKRKGAPILGNRVWVGANATICGNVHIGDNVLIAANTFVNCDVPSYSIVIGNPCIIKHDENATKDYIRETDYLDSLLMKL